MYYCIHHYYTVITSLLHIITLTIITYYCKFIIMYNYIILTHYYQSQSPKLVDVKR